MSDSLAFFDKYYEQLIEGIAATDDILLEKYLGGEDITRADALNARATTARPACRR